jgi:hypothetical protein
MAAGGVEPTVVGDELVEDDGGAGATVVAVVLVEVVEVVEVDVVDVVDVVVGDAATSGMWRSHPVRGCALFAVDAARLFDTCSTSAVTPCDAAIDCHVSSPSTV